MVNSVICPQQPLPVFKKIIETFSGHSNINIEDENRRPLTSHHS